MGIYDNFILNHLKESFISRKYKVQQDIEPHLCEIVAKSKEAKTLFMFDATVRAKIFGYDGAHSLFRAVSQNVFIPDIKTPTFALVAKDDAIT